MLYLYRCPDCGQTDELFLPIGLRDSAWIRCRPCHDLNYAVGMRRVVTAPAIRGATVARS
jgi:predicted nucleic acid-binding Zn ribbon protein